MTNAMLRESGLKLGPRYRIMARVMPQWRETDLLWQGQFMKRWESNAPKRRADPQVVDAAGEDEMGGLPDLDDEYIDMPDLEDPDEDEVVYVAAGGDNLLYTYMRGLPEEGIIYYEVNRRGSLDPHAHHLAAEQFVQARFEGPRLPRLHIHAHLLYMRPNTSSKAPAP